MKLITDKDIQNLKISNADFFSWAEDMIKNKNDACLPAKTSIKQPGHIFYNFMPCVIEKLNIAGIKIVNRYPQRTPCITADLLLYDYTNGKLKAIMDATYITTMRTGAIAAHTVMLFAKADFNTISFIGLGNTINATADILFEKLSSKNLTIKLYKYKDHAERFIEKYKDIYNFTFKICNTYEDTITNSDVILSGITYAESDFCDDSYYKPGCLVVPIHTLGFQNCDLFFDKVYGDDYNHIYDFKYFNRFKNFAEVSAVVNNLHAGRENNSERILVYNIGLATHDVYFAYNIYNRIASQNKDIL